jgi:hypothetical protein
VLLECAAHLTADGPIALIGELGESGGEITRDAGCDRGFPFSVCGACFAHVLLFG